ncbi:Uncharacterized protein XB16_3118 [Leptospira santarosai]|uniref:Uncharacterized protein n=1 Tax=Leptospira santarosai TaxID=28183 RepID=A0A2P1QWX0_9LEPT|nr:Uncharacterized protein XB16_3118 [Leptospira santarosai]
MRYFRNEKIRTIWEHLIGRVGSDQNLSQKKLNDTALYGSQRPLTLFAELNDTALYGSQRPLTLFAELNDTALYGSQRPLTLFAELNDTALYGSQRQGIFVRQIGSIAKLREFDLLYSDV